MKFSQKIINNIEKHKKILKEGNLNAYEQLYLKNILKYNYKILLEMEIEYIKEEDLLLKSKTLEKYFKNMETHLIYIILSKKYNKKAISKLKVLRFLKFVKLEKFSKILY